MRSEISQYLIDRALSVPIGEVMNLSTLRKATSQEYKGACPYCGGDDRFSVQVRANRPDTWLCRHCSPSYKTVIGLVMRWQFGSLPRHEQFSNALEYLLREKLPTISAPKSTIHGDTVAWQKPKWFTDELLIKYLSHPDRFAIWNDHKGITNEEVEARKFGVGVLPQSRCNHPRLIVPVFENGEIVALRGRQLDCKCGRKKEDGTLVLDRWLTAKGSKKSLYGLDELRPNGKQTVFIIENNVDTRFIVRQGWVGLAPTTGVATVWEESWIEQLAQANPAQVIIAFDNGPEGCPSESLLRAWQAANPDKKPPLNGQKLQRQLARHRIYPRIWTWMKEAPQGADIAWYYTQRMGT